MKANSGNATEYELIENHFKIQDPSFKAIQENLQKYKSLKRNQNMNRTLKNFKIQTLKLNHNEIPHQNQNIVFKIKSDNFENHTAVQQNLDNPQIMSTDINTITLVNCENDVKFENNNKNVRSNGGKFEPLLLNQIKQKEASYQQSTKQSNFEVTTRDGSNCRNYKNYLLNNNLDPQNSYSNIQGGNKILTSIKTGSKFKQRNKIYHFASTAGDYSSKTRNSAGVFEGGSNIIKSNNHSISREQLQNSNIYNTNSIDLNSSIELTKQHIPQIKSSLERQFMLKRNSLNKTMANFKTSGVRQSLNSIGGNITRNEYSLKSVSQFPERKSSIVDRFSNQQQQRYNSSTMKMIKTAKDSQAANSDGSTLHSQLADKIKDFRREMSEKRNLNDIEKDESVNKFRSTIQSFGLNISKQAQKYRRSKETSFVMQTTTNPNAPEVKINRNKSNFRSLLLVDNSQSPKKGALSTQAGDSYYLMNGGAQGFKNCNNCGTSIKLCICKSSSIDQGQSLIKFTITKSETITTKADKKGSKNQSYTVYHIEVQTCISEWSLVFRYSELKKFHETMKKLVPSSNQIPKFPSKKIWKNDEKVINERRVQLMDYLNNLSKKADLIQYEYACNFLKIEGYLRDYLNDLVGRSDNESPQNCGNKSQKRKSILDSLRRSTHRQGTKNSDDREENNDFDFMDNNSESEDDSLHRIPMKLTKSTVEIKSKKSDISPRHNYSKKTLSSSMIKTSSTPSNNYNCGGDANILEPEIDLLTLYKKLRLTDEEIVLTFFKNINTKEQSKDHWIRDFEDFYFKIRPKFQSKLIKLLLEGDMTINIQGLFYFMSEIQTSFVSACSTIQLISKLIDFQKNIYADSFIKELVRIDPNNMRKYNFEGFLEKENSEGYRQSALHILQIYVDRRIAFKNTIGTIAGNLKHAEAFENQRQNMILPQPSIKNETEEHLIGVIVKDPKLQQEVLNIIRAKNVVNQHFSTSSAPNMNPQLKKQDSSRKLNSTFLLAKKRNSQLNTIALQNASQQLQLNTQSNESFSSPSDLNDQAGSSSFSRTPNKSEDFTEILIRKFQSLKYEELMKDIANSQVKVNHQVSNILEYMHISSKNKSSDLFIKICDILTPKQPILFKLTNIQDFQVHAALMKQLKSSNYSIRTLKYLDHSSQLLEISRDSASNSRVQIMLQLCTYSSPTNSSEKFLFYIISVNSTMNESKIEDSQERYVVLCLKKTRNLVESEITSGTKNMIESFNKDKTKSSVIEGYLFFKKGSLFRSSTFSNERFTTTITDTNLVDRTLTQEDLKGSGAQNLSQENDSLNLSLNDNEEKLIQALKSSISDMFTGQGDENISDNNNQQQVQIQNTQNQQQQQKQTLLSANSNGENGISNQQEKVVQGIMEKLVDIICEMQGYSSSQVLMTETSNNNQSSNSLQSNSQIKNQLNITNAQQQQQPPNDTKTNNTLFKLIRM